MPLALQSENTINKYSGLTTKLHIDLIRRTVRKAKKYIFH